MSKMAQKVLQMLTSLICMTQQNTNKSYQVTFKKDISGRILMTWQDDKLLEHGKYKNNNTDGTWKDIEELFNLSLGLL